MSLILSLVFFTSNLWAQSGPSITYRGLGETCASLLRPMNHDLPIEFSDAMSNRRQAQQILRQTKFYVEDLVRRYPPEKYYLVLFGAPANLIANMLLLQMNHQQAKSYFKSLPVVNLNDVFGWESQKRAATGQLDFWFDNALPEIKNLKQRHLVVVRPLMYGATLLRFAPFLVGYLARKKLENRVHFELTGLYSENFAPDWSQNPVVASISITTGALFTFELPFRGGGPDMINADSGPYKNIEAVDLQSQSDAAQPNPKFSVTQEKLRSLFMMTKDSPEATGSTNSSYLNRMKRFFKRQ